MNLDERKRTITEKLNALEESEEIYLQSVSATSQALLQFQKRILMLEEALTRTSEEKMHYEGQLTLTLTLINLGVLKALVGVKNIERILTVHDLITKEDVETKDEMFQAECNKQQRVLDKLLEEKYQCY